MMFIKYVLSDLSIILSVLVYVNSFPVTPEIVTEYEDIVRKCITRANISKKDLFGLKKAEASEIKAEIIKAFAALKQHANELKQHANELKLNANKYREERDIRLYYQSLLDMKERIKELFDNCWPTWTTKQKPTRTYSTSDFEILLMNIEHPIIFNLKKSLKASNIPEEEFIRIAIDLIEMRNDQAHRRMNDAEKEEAFYRLNGTFGSGIHPAVVHVLLFNIRKDDTTSSKQDLPDQINQDVYATTRNQRKKFKMVMIPNYKAPGKDEKPVEEAVNHFVKTQETKKNDDINIKPTAIAVTTIGTFVLFDDFEGAYYFWSNRHEINLLDTKSDIHIIDPNEDSRIVIGNDNEWYIGVGTTKGIICNKINSIINNSEEIHWTITPKLYSSASASAGKSKTETTSINKTPRENAVGSNDDTQMETTTEPNLFVYYDFAKLEVLLKTYQLLKSKIDPGVNVTLQTPFKIAEKNKMTKLIC